VSDDATEVAMCGCGYIQNAAGIKLQLCAKHAGQASASVVGSVQQLTTTPAPNEIRYVHGECPDCKRLRDRLLTLEGLLRKCMVVFSRIYRTWAPLDSDAEASVTFEHIDNTWNAIKAALDTGGEK
jgi:hypothetical protein